MDIADYCGGADSAPEEEFLQRFSVGEIREAVMQLPRADCEVLWLLLFRELTVAEIANLTGLKNATVRSRICRARRRLRQLLEERGIGEHDGQRRAGKVLSG